jgi:dihydroneopterin aldolase
VSDCIIVKDLRLFAHHGVLEEERRLGQRFAVDVTAFLDLRPAGESDDYRKTVGYDAIVETATEVLIGRRFRLIEAAAEAVAQAILSGFPPVERVIVELRKPSAPIDAVFDHVAVRIERSRGG